MVPILARTALERAAEVSTTTPVLACMEHHGVTVVVMAMEARMAAGGIAAVEGKVGATMADQQTTIRQLVMLPLLLLAGGEMRVVDEDMNIPE